MHLIHRTEEVDDIRNLLAHLEEEHGKGSVSDSTYKELKAKYEGKIAEAGQTDGPKEENKMKEISVPGGRMHELDVIKGIFSLHRGHKEKNPTKTESAEPSRAEALAASVSNAITEIKTSVQQPDTKTENVELGVSATGEGTMPTAVSGEVSKPLAEEPVPTVETGRENIETNVVAAAPEQPEEQKEKHGFLDRILHHKHETQEKAKLEESIQSGLQAEQAISELQSTEMEKQDTQTEAKGAESEKVDEENLGTNASSSVENQAYQALTETPIQEPKQSEEVQTKAPVEKEKKPGLLGKILHKKEEQDVPDTGKKEGAGGEGQVESQKNEETQVSNSPVRPEQQAAEQQQVEAQPDTQKPVPDLTIEIEKIKAVIDTMRETKKATDDTLANIFESIGEVRSMAFQTDGSLKEASAKLERIEEDINEISPKVFVKKINDINSALEKHNMFLEKLEAKSGDLSEKINQVYTMLKTIGGIENLVGLNQEMQKKLGEIREVVKYIERISVKAEKTYLDLNERLNDYVLYKSKQDALDESMKDMIKAIDKLGLNFENYSSKKDLDALRTDLSLVQSQAQELGKALPMLQMKIPDDIMILKKEREDITLLLESMQEQVNLGSITRREYERIRKKNEHKLRKIDNELKKDWARLSRYIPRMLEEAKPEAPAKTENTEQPAPPAASVVVEVPKPVQATVQTTEKEEAPAEKEGKKGRANRHRTKKNKDDMERAA